MPFTEDLTAFFDDDDFAWSATFTPTSGSASTPQVIFDESYAAELGIAATNPAAIGRASDFGASVTVDGTLLINGTTYTIRERELLDDGATVRLQLVIAG